MKFLLILFLLINSISFVQARTILISDVDDTIKDSRVRDISEALKRVSRTGPEMMVSGMNEAYQEMQDQGMVDDFLYVSKLFSVLDHYHERFLLKNKFPLTRLYTKGFERDFKFETILYIIQSLDPSEVILVGDNGQNDSYDYNRIVNYFAASKIKFHTFIRKAYSEGDIRAGQVSFYEGQGFLREYINQKNLMCNFSLVLN